MARLLVIGPGDMGARMAFALGQSGRLDEIVIAGRAGGRGPQVAAVVASTCDVVARFVPVDGTDAGAVARLVGDARPDVILQSATLLSPWAMFGRGDALATALRGAGLGVALSMQLPVVTAVMRGAREAGFAGPVVNLSFPDVTNVILDRQGLAPTCGVGNVSIMQLRARAALRAERGPGAPLPLLRLVGQHAQLFGVLRSTPPADPATRPRVYVGEEGERHDGLPYGVAPIEPGSVYNEVTVGAVVPTVLALLPGAEPLRFSVPGPLGLPGGYPVAFADGGLALDLPPGATLEDAVAFNEAMQPGDGVLRVDADGTAHVTEAAAACVADVAPWLAEPLHPDEVPERSARMARLIADRA